MNILFFTISAGEGHNQVANTLAEELFEVDKNNKIEIIDAFNYINPKLHKVLMEVYIKSIKYMPELYSFFYKKTTESDSSFYDIGELLNKAFVSRKINRLLLSFKPDVIICTHPIPIEALCMLKRKNKIKTPILTTLTDYTLHSAWLKKDIDYYIISSEILKYELEHWQIPVEKCKFFGIPVRKAFYEKQNRQEICNELDLKNTFTALIMGGGLGLGNITDTLDYLVCNKLDIQIVVIAGKNKDLYNNLKAKYNKDNNLDNVRIYGYMSDIHKIMSISDVIITKPGGLTVAEAITKELPIIITCNLPGQEERNAEFILNNGIGMVATSPHSLISSINILKENSDKYNMIKSNMNRLKKPKACSEIVNLILTMANEKKSHSL